MAYDTKSRRGVLPHHLSSKAGSFPASSTTASRFVDVIKSVRPDNGLRFGSFSDVLQHDGRPIAVTFNAEANRMAGAGQPFGLAAVHNVARRRKWLWENGRNPGIYAITKTVYVERIWSAGSQTALQDDLQAKVSETTRPVAAYGIPEERTVTRRATENEVVQAIEMVTQAYDAAFMAEAGVTTERPPLSSGDNPMSIPPPTIL